MSQAITLNGYNLQSDTVFTESINHEQVVRDMAKVKIPHRDGEKLVSSTYGSRPIPIQGKIIVASISGMDGKIDEMKAALINSLGVNLDLDYAGTTRRFVVNVRSIAFARQYYSNTMVPFSIDCEAVNPPFGQGLTTVSGYFSTTQSGTWSATTSGINATQNMTVSGTANPQPQITFTVNVSGSLRGFQVYNVTTNSSIYITTGTTTAADKFIINTKDYTVKKNGATFTTYSGIFPTFQPGVNQLLITAYGTAPDFAYGTSVEYNPYYD